jgi:hypothetical protein
MSLIDTSFLNKTLSTENQHPVHNSNVLLVRTIIFLSFTDLKLFVRVLDSDPDSDPKYLLFHPDKTKSGHYSLL